MHFYNTKYDLLTNISMFPLQMLIALVAYGKFSHNWIRESSVVMHPIKVHGPGWHPYFIRKRKNVFGVGVHCLTTSGY